jgi:5-methyltetrahydrofolate--homocysteine methyltransferase
LGLDSFTQVAGTQLHPYLEALQRGIVIFDGAMGTNIQRAAPTVEDFGGAQREGCNEILNLTRPDMIEAIHRSFLEVGVDAIETNTFGANRVVLSEYGLADQVTEINKAAVAIARSACEKAGRPGTFVAGSIGPGTKLPSLGQITFDDLVAAYREQSAALLEAGVDLILIETVFDLLQAKAAVLGARQAMEETGVNAPVQVQVTIELTGRMLPGTEIAAALHTLVAMRPDVIGMNCATGPQEMIEPLTYLSRHSPLPISVLPNAGLPKVVDGRMHYDLTPEELARHLSQFVEELGVQVIGGCCGTTPEHLREVVRRCRGLKPPSRRVEFEPSATSLYTAVPFRQEGSVLMIGERTNANGSKRFREAMLAGDWETCVKMAREQVAEGAHLVDLCVDYTGFDGTTAMSELASRLATASTAPLVLDSTEAEVIEAALKHLGAKPVLNSVNLEEGEGPGTRLDKFLRLAATYGAAVICTCIDERGQARDRRWKLEVAKRIASLATERYGIPPGDILIDPLVLPITTGMEESRRDGLETIEAIALIDQELPEAHTVIGLSNVSFGLAPGTRQILNSVFLDECVKAGLDAAILHAGKIVPLSRIPEDLLGLCLDLIYDRRRDGYDPLQELLSRTDEVSRQAKGPSLEDLPLEQRLVRRIVEGNREGLEDDLRSALEAGYDPLGIINDLLLAGMKEVGDLFGSGKMQLPFVLQSAETMKAAVSFLEPYMEKAETSSKGKIVLATVAGDVHDIGKNLVDIILSNNGYTVYNLGIKVGISEMIEAAKKYQADAIGMSGLLVKSTLVMRDNLIELNNQGMHHIPVLLGGAALTRSYVEKDLRSIYKGRVFYGRDAFEGLAVMDRLMEIKRTGQDDPDFGRKVPERKLPPRKSERLAKIDPATLPKRSPHIRMDNEIPRPPFIGTRVAKGIPLDEIAAYLNETALFRNQWGFRPREGESDQEFKARVRATLREELEKAKTMGILVPQVVWGYFPANSEGNDLLVFSDESRSAVIERFTFPRQREDPYYCIADFFRPLESGELDFVAFMVVTMGERASSFTKRLFEENRYREYVFQHGLSVEMTEALAEYWHYRIRLEWGIAGEDASDLIGIFKQGYRGGRYSWGYPACPNLEDNEKVVRLLDAKRIGVSVSEGYQLVPEQTTLAIVCHHPQAKYFVA